MTTFIQAIIGALCFLSAPARTNPIILASLTIATALTLNLSMLHLGRPAYAWRALKMWKRSWLSREVLLFGLFLAALGALALVSALPLFSRWNHFSLGPSLDPWPTALSWIAMAIGVAAIVASACIYLIPARPAWNKIHTPLDFLLSAALLGELFASQLTRAAIWLTHLHFEFLPLPSLIPPSLILTKPSAILAAATALIWLANQAVRMGRLRRSTRFEDRASSELALDTPLRNTFIAAMLLVAAAAVLALAGQNALAFAAALAGVLSARYLFFVSVVPLNMALTFLKAGSR
jgi:DMSO reductase anchor subunit